MNNTIRKIRTISTEGMVQQDIEVPEDKGLYGEHIMAKVVELFEAQPDAKAVLVGIDVSGFRSRREEGETFSAFIAAGFGWSLVGWNPKSAFSGVLVTRK
ncbi:hypothetical protein [Xanthomonas phage RTH11]|nr:hypothetical protein [Xanthomonas phage RTH11]